MTLLVCLQMLMLCLQIIEPGCLMTFKGAIFENIAIALVLKRFEMEIIRT